MVRSCFVLGKDKMDGQPCLATKRMGSYTGTAAFSSLKEMLFKLKPKRNDLC